MADEIERRFKVEDGFHPAGMEKALSNIRQSYIYDTGGWTIRVRREETNGIVQHFMTMKRPKTRMTAREYDIPITEVMYADIRLSCGHEVVKTRYRVPHAGRTWEVDVYADPRLDPAILVEIELPSEDENVDFPQWLGEEVTGNRWYSNHQIATRIEWMNGEQGN